MIPPPSHKVPYCHSQAVIGLAVAVLTPAQLANQVRVNMRNEAAAFYDFTLHSDDEMNPLQTRNVCLRTPEVCISPLHLTQCSSGLFLPLIPHFTPPVSRGFISFTF